MVLSVLWYCAVLSNGEAHYATRTDPTCDCANIKRTTCPQRTPAVDRLATTQSQNYSYHRILNPALLPALCCHCHLLPQAAQLLRAQRDPVARRAQVERLVPGPRWMHSGCFPRRFGRCLCGARAAAQLAVPPAQRAWVAVPARSRMGAPSLQNPGEHIADCRLGSWADDKGTQEHKAA